MKQNIQLIPCKSIIASDEFKKRPLCICDFYLQGCENGTRDTKAIWFDNIINIDHHAPLADFEHFISSGNIAIEYVKRYGPTQLPIVINHTDCDSVLSSAIMAGRLPPEAQYGEAVIAADHTGEENKIADLLQSLTDLRDFEYSLKMLDNLENGRGLEAKAEA